MPERTAPDFDALGITDRCSRCGRPYDEHPHAFGEDCIIGNPHAFRSQPMPGRGSESLIWPDGRFESWAKWPPHLAPKARYRVCSNCGRFSWSEDAGAACKMTQPGGLRCTGVFSLETFAPND